MTEFTLENLEKTVSARPSYMRKGQVAFDYANRFFPNFCDSIVDTDSDCFTKDSNYGKFVKALTDYINDGAKLDTEE